MASGGYIMYRDFNSKKIQNKQDFRKLKKKFNQILDGIGNTDTQNKIEQRFEILKYIPMEYGCDTVVSIPLGLDLSDFHKIIPKLKVALNAEIIAELSTSKKCIYTRIHYRDREIADKWDMRIKWYQLMFNGEGSNRTQYRNRDYDTFMIKEVIEEKYGYKMTVNVPVGLNYSVILDNLKQITNAYKCNVWGEYKRENSELIITIIKEEIPDDYLYEPIKTKPNEFYIGMTYDYKPIVVDLEYYPHGMYSGMTRMGKTIAVLMAVTNLIYWHSPSEVELYFSQISSKQDLNIFRKVKHCKYYADNVNNLLKMLKYLERIMTYRNKILVKGDEYFENIYKWNKKHPYKKFSEIYYIGDESAMLQPSAYDSDSVITTKKKCLSLLTTLYQQGGSAGLHIFNSLQRPSKDSFDAPMKAQVGLKICFKQPNNASSLVVLDDNTATELKKREAIVEFDNRYLMKTLYLDKEMILKYTEKWQLKEGEYLNLDDNGNIAPVVKKEKKKEEDIDIKEDNNVQDSELSMIEIPIACDELTNNISHIESQNNRRNKYFSKPRKDGK